MSELTPQQKFEKLKLLEQREKLREGLPFLYGMPRYGWGEKFRASRNRITLLCAANQIGKSTEQIRKCLEWATSPQLWTELWQTRPIQFWYLYPSKDVATIEFETKWAPLMPQGEWKEHPVFGWTAEYKDGDIYAVYFNSGIRLYFKTYAQNKKTLQTGSVHAMFCFTEGHLLFTKKGLTPIEQVQVGDSVLGRGGWNTVLKKHAPRKTKVITRKFKSGVSLTATPEHPFYVLGKGWVQFGSLTEEDRCLTLPVWKLIEKLFCLKEVYLKDCQKALTSVFEIILEVKKVCFSTLLCGKHTINRKFQRVTVFTTKILTPWTIAYQTCSFSHEKSTPGFINLKSGGKKGYITSTATYVINLLQAGVVRGKSHVFALWSAVDRSIEKTWCVLLAVVGLVLEKIHTKDSVLSSAPTQGDTEVYNIEVSNTHSYFCNGFLTHNCDEELPEDLFDELMFRLAATGGYFHMVFTATLGQQLWWDAIEERGDREKFPDAHKQQVSMYDCLTYADGTATPWSKEKIQSIENSCKNHNEIRRRVHGGFVKDEGLKYPTYSPQKHFKPYHPVPPSWRVYPGIDMGGGGDGHPAGIVFLAVDPLYQKGRVILSWRGDDQITTAADVVNKFIELKGQTEVMPPRFDFAAKDLGTIASRMGLAFMPADKSHEKGELILNTLFKHNMLEIYDNSDNPKLSTELLNLRNSTAKRKARDNLVDPLRYAAVSVPWDFSILGEDAPMKEIKAPETDVDLRRKPFLSQEDESFSVEDELDAWNEMYGAD